LGEWVGGGWVGKEDREWRATTGEEVKKNRGGYWITERAMFSDLRHQECVRASAVFLSSPLHFFLIFFFFPFNFNFLTFKI
jgi:hypothetical protein